MRANGIKPQIAGRHYAYPCTCGHHSCKSWMVAGVAEVQGVSFTQAEAVLVADVLNIVQNVAHGVMTASISPYVASLEPAILDEKKRRGL
jgi:hypothetical protein